MSPLRRKEVVMAKTATSSRKSSKAVHGASASIVERSEDASKAKSKAASSKARGRAAAPVSAAKRSSAAKTSGHSTKSSTSTAAKSHTTSRAKSSSIATKVVEGLKATATGALGAVSMAAQALTPDKKLGKRK